MVRYLQASSSRLCQAHAYPTTKKISFNRIVPTIKKNKNEENTKNQKNKNTKKTKRFLLLTCF